MNVEGAEVERRLGPHDHAALPRRLQPRHRHRRGDRRGRWPALGVPLAAHLVVRRASLIVVVGAVAVRGFLPSSAHAEDDAAAERDAAARPGWSRAPC